MAAERCPWPALGRSYLIIILSSTCGPCAGVPSYCNEILGEWEITSSGVCLAMQFPGRANISVQAQWGSGPSSMRATFR